MLTLAWLHFRRVGTGSQAKQMALSNTLPAAASSRPPSPGKCLVRWGQMRALPGTNRCWGSRGVPGLQALLLMPQADRHSDLCGLAW